MHKVNVWLLAGVLSAASFLSAASEHVGKKLRVVLKSGDEVVGVLKSEDMNSVELATDSGNRTILVRDIQHAYIVKDESGLVIEGDSSSPTSAVSSGPTAYHRFGIISLGAGSQSGGAEISTYEYIGQNRWGIKVALLNAYVRSKQYTETQRSGSWTYTSTEYADTVNYAPVWVRRYLTSADNPAWPYLGLGLAYHNSVKSHVLTPDETKTGIVPAGEFGLDFGGKMLRGSLGLLYFPGDSDTSIITFNFGLSLLWKAQ